MGPQEPKDVTHSITRDLSTVAGKLASMKGEATHWLEGADYETLRLRLELAHAAAEATLVEVRRQVRLDEGRSR